MAHSLYSSRSATAFDHNVSANYRCSDECRRHAINSAQRRRGDISNARARSCSRIMLETLPAIPPRSFLRRRSAACVRKTRFSSWRADGPTPISGCARLWTMQRAAQRGRRAPASHVDLCRQSSGVHARLRGFIDVDINHIDRLSVPLCFNVSSSPRRHVRRPVCQSIDIDRSIIDKDLSLLELYRQIDRYGSITICTDIHRFIDL